MSHSDAAAGAFDPLLTPGAFNYWKNPDFYGAERCADTLVDYVGMLRTECEIFIGELGAMS